MEQFPDVVSLRRTVDEGQALDDVFERFPEDTPAEVMALADGDEGSSRSVEYEDFEGFVEDLATPRSPSAANDSAREGAPIDLTAEELFGD